MIKTRHLSGGLDHQPVLMFDVVTFGTNNEGRPMGVTACPVLMAT